MNKMVQRLVALVLMTGISVGSAAAYTSYLQTCAMTVNGDKVSPAEYAGYMIYYKSSIENMYAGMGLTNIWDDEAAGPMLEQQLATSAKDQATLVHVILQKMKEHNLELTEEQQQQIADRQQELIDQLGETEYKEQLATFGFNEESYEQSLYLSACLPVLEEYYFGENGIRKVTEESLLDYFQKNYLRAKHILLLIQDPVTGESVRTPEEAKQEITALLERIRAGEDFDTLMKEYSEDPGLESNPDGYIFTEGQMVDPFYQGALALQEGDVSEPIGMDYGYHIIKRLPLEAESNLEQYRDEISNRIGTIDTLLQEWMDEADVKTTPTLTQITVQNVYDYADVAQPADQSEQTNQTEGENTLVEPETPETTETTEPAETTPETGN